MTALLRWLRLTFYLFATAMAFWWGVYMMCLNTKAARAFGIIMLAIATNAALWALLLWVQVIHGIVPDWREWATTINALFLVCAPMALAWLFRQGGNGHEC